MPHGDTVPLYTSVEGKRDNVVSAGIKNWRIVRNHYFSLCHVPIIQSHIITSSKKNILVRWSQATLRSLEDGLHAAVWRTDSMQQVPLQKLILPQLLEKFLAFGSRRFIISSQQLATCP